MGGKVVLPAAAADPRSSGGGGSHQPEANAARAAPTGDRAAQADLRLIIEEAERDGQYVYTVVDRRTGRVVSRLARDEVLRLSEQDGYSAGTVFNGKV